MHLIFSIQPDIYIGGLRIAEPVVSLTGLIIGAVSGYAYLRIKRIHEPLPEQRWMGLFFAFMSFSAIVGAFLGHAFLYMFPFYFKLPGWILSMVAASTLERSSIIHAGPWVGEKKLSLFLSLNLIKLLVFVGIIAANVYYPIAQIHTAICMLVGMAVPEVYLWRRFKDPSSRLLLLSIVPILFAALVGVFKLSLSIWFVHEDVSHMFICVGLWLLMLGAEQMKHQEQPAMVTAD